MDTNNIVAPKAAEEALKNLESSQRFTLGTLNSVSKVTGAETVQKASEDANRLREAAQEISKK